MSTRMVIRLDQRHKDMMSQVARSRGLSLSGWMRYVLIEHAEKALGHGAGIGKKSGSMEERFRGKRADGPASESF